VAASVVWLTAGGLLLATRVSDLSAVLAGLAVTLLGFAAALDSGFLIGTGAFDYTTTCLFRIKFLAILVGSYVFEHADYSVRQYYDLLTPGRADRPQQNIPLAGGNSTASDTCVGARNHD